MGEAYPIPAEALTPYPRPDREGDDMSELKPCPFCGGEAYFARLSGTHGGVKCRTCNSSGDLHSDKALAIAAWNRRVEPGWQPISSAPRDGWVLVPREPTEEMIQAAIKRPNDSGDGLYADVYRAMVRAAPPTPAHAELSPGNSSDLRGEEG